MKKKTSETYEIKSVKQHIINRQLQVVINGVEELLQIAENTLSYCEMDMDNKGNRDISEELKDMYNRALTEQRCYAKVLKMLLALSDNLIDE